MSTNFWLVGVLTTGVVFSAVGYRVGSQIKTADVKHEVVSLPAPSPTATPVTYTYCSNPNCGTISIPKDQCSDTKGYVCCNVGQKWMWYASRGSCKFDQDAESKSPSPSAKL